MRLLDIIKVRSVGDPLNYHIHWKGRGRLSYINSEVEGMKTAPPGRHPYRRSSGSSLAQCGIRWDRLLITRTCPMVDFGDKKDDATRD